MNNLNNIVADAMGFIFELDRQQIRDSLIEIVSYHAKTIQAEPLNTAVKHKDNTCLHPDRPKQVRGSIPTVPVALHPEMLDKAIILENALKIVETDSKRAQKTLTQLVRGHQTDQDLRDSLPDSLAQVAQLSHLTRTRQPAFLYEKREPRVYANILKDIEMIEGYINARLLFR